MAPLLTQAPVLLLVLFVVIMAAKTIATMARPSQAIWASLKTIDFEFLVTRLIFAQADPLADGPLRHFGYLGFGR